MTRKQLSRRELLIGMGLIGAATTACACSSAATLGLWLINQQKTAPNNSINTPLQTVTPRFTMPVTVSRTAWGALAPNHNATNENGFYSASNIEGWRVYDGDIQAAYQTVIIHHAAFYIDNDLETLAEVQSVHRNQRGWADVAYHFLIGQNGLIYEGRDWHVRGTHVGSYNTGSLGICLLGNFMTQTPTLEQLTSTLNLVNWASEFFALTHIASHRDFNPQTQCPGDNLFPYMDQFSRVSGLTLGIDGYIPPDEASACWCCACGNSI